MIEHFFFPSTYLHYVQGYLSLLCSNVDNNPSKVYNKKYPRIKTMQLILFVGHEMALTNDHPKLAES